MTEANGSNRRERNDMFFEMVAYYLQGCATVFVFQGFMFCPPYHRKKNPTSQPPLCGNKEHITMKNQTGIDQMVTDCKNLYIAALGFESTMNDGGEELFTLVAAEEHIYHAYEYLKEIQENRRNGVQSSMVM